MRRILLAIALAAGAVFADEERVQTRVQLTSQPVGASICVDGEVRGVTPKTLFDLSKGRHRIKYSLAGYVDEDRFVNVNNESLVEDHACLAEEKGLLLLKTDPEGCNISVDGVSIGETPMLITSLSVKDRYSVKLAKTGYQPLVVEVRFDGRNPVVREERLIPDSGAIEIVSEPSGAKVMVNGIVRGTAPIKVTGIPKGRAKVELALDGFKGESRELAIAAGDEQTLVVALKALPGTLHLTSVPSGARFYLGDEARGTSPLSIAGLEPGSYVVRAELDGYAPLVRTIELENGASAREEFRLENVMGRLEVRTSPAEVQLVMDGKVVGVTKSSDPDAEFSDVFTIENLMEGEHSLVARKDGYAETIRHPKIRQGKTSQHNLRLKRVFVPDIEIVTSRGNVYRGIMKGTTAETLEVEISLGIVRSFPRSEIREVKTLTDGK